VASAHNDPELDLLLATLPQPVQTALAAYPLTELLEIVLDYGRVPEARFNHIGCIELPLPPVDLVDLAHVISRIGPFSGDNRAGLPRTLHRISAMRNRQGEVIGLTCRVGKAIMGTVTCLQDLITANKSLLLLGRPGVGKTTKLREIARILSTQCQKRVVIVDTSNEIAGDGDIPHAAVGRARRMQVATPEAQEHVMIEAVENHTPEAIIVDEIGTEAEAQAARTIAERGVLLIATAHGGELGNLIKNPVLSDLVGGIQSVTLGDDEAKRRSSQKTVLEREKKPTFDICVELRDRHTMAVYPNLEEAVDHLLRGWTLYPEVRKESSEGQVRILHASSLVALPVPVASSPAEASAPLEVSDAPPEGAMTMPSGLQAVPPALVLGVNDQCRVFLYGLTRSFMQHVLQQQGLDTELHITETMHEAHFILALRGQARPGAKVLRLAADYDIPVFYAKTNTQPQLVRALCEALGDLSEDVNSPFVGRWAEHLDQWQRGTQPLLNADDVLAQAMHETQQAIEHILAHAEPVELKPRRSYIRRLQHELAERYNINSLSVGDEPNRRLKLLP
jgi:stage III sporulation protein SpoIIIAA